VSRQRRTAFCEVVTVRNIIYGVLFIGNHCPLITVVLKTNYCSFEVFTRSRLAPERGACEFRVSRFHLKLREQAGKEWTEEEAKMNHDWTAVASTAPNELD
jgi:hypothetical protein